MINKFFRLFKKEEEQERSEVNYVHPKGNRKVQREIEVRVTYIYPKNTSFSVSDLPKKRIREKSEQRNRPQRDEESRNSRLHRNVESRRNTAPTQKESVKKQPFKPSKFASPVYGYHKVVNREVENTPTFMRNEIHKEKESTVESLKKVEKPLKQENLIENRDLKHKEQVTLESAAVTENTLLRDRPSEQLTKREIQNPSYKVETKEKYTLTSSKVNKVPINNTSEEKDYTLSGISSNEGMDYYIPLHLLNDPVEKDDRDEEWIEEQKYLLEQTLNHFNVDAKVVQATQGPTVTRFEVQPELGVKVSRIRNLSDDIKMNMAAKDIRIEAPIPGKNRIGIEVPNAYPQAVGLQEIIDSDDFIKHASNLSIGLGLTIEGDPYITSIDKMPHGLIAGATGSGKSVCINSIIISLLYKSHYEDVKLLLIDPKMVELAPYNEIPHLISPVITDVKAANAALKWAVEEMDERYELFAKHRVRDIHKYNEKAEESGMEKMPQIVIIIDELADLMMVAPQDVEESISRIAQKARACGMHLLIATQRPSVDVITGLIKANIPTRIAFSVSSQVDSRTIIDTNGAERLLGRGDMLFSENGSGNLLRLQGAFVSDEEIERVTNYVRSLSEPSYLFVQEELLERIDFDDEVDELFEEVVQLILEHEKASTSMLQRHFNIGYNRAARIIDTLEQRGMISEQKGSKPRDVLFTIDQLEQYL